MAVSFLEWFRDDDGWTTPDGRRGELAGLVIGLPIFLFVVTGETGLPDPFESPSAVLFGTLCGFCYAAYWRQRLCALIPERVRNFAMGSLLSGGLGLSLLEGVDLAVPTVLFVLAAIGTILAIYLAWLLSPIEDGLQPPRRGASPPQAVESTPTR
ncbi:hypothetical protein [Natronorubrum texcoconense]|uniref:Uncharacterized protein n=1 Tax=Natronorubrum texcoconense TaxID=1095776 RepID=A0A1G8WT61_9EURY|nr:hypothetical protein [Natronorubrum texcoconense]SDJ81579.1 hypothetical protein SAMN04515672_1506 [Natronorubrum texcoconense]